VVVTNAAPPIPFDQLAIADLTVERVYQGAAGNWADDPLAQLPVGNQGGFWTHGSPANGSPAKDEVRLVVLFTSGAEPDWPDALDVYTSSHRDGNCMTRRAGATCCCARSSSGLMTEHRAVPALRRSSCSTGPGGEGMCVPRPAGSWFRSRLSCEEDLVAVWRTTAGQRFQNYRAQFTVLDAESAWRTWIGQYPRWGTRWAVYVLRRGGHGCSPVPIGRCWVRPR
jgi:hypothetical protein